MSEETIQDHISNLGTALPASAEEEELETLDMDQVIGLNLGEEQFIVDILNVREIVRFNELEITRVPHSHYYVLGVVNLRGKVVPVVDLSRRLQLSIKERDNKARMIVVEIGESVIGFTVDSVSEVLRLPQNAIEPATSEDAYIVGVATVDGQIMTMLDLGQLLSETVENGSLGLNHRSDT